MKKHNEYYWDNKKSRTEQAVKHTDEVAKKYPNEIADSVQRTTIYDATLKRSIGIPMDGYPKNIKYSVVEEDSVSAIFDCAQGKTAVLNFASYKYPGGGFMVGSRAQEECLCHESFLYNVISQQEEYYAWNRKNLNKALYKPRALYSPDIIFERDGKTQKCDVITCAAPNFSAASNFVNRIENDRVLDGRIRFILEIAKKENVDTLILGAFGCGVFQQTPETVAELFDKGIKSVFCDKNINAVFAVIPPLPNQTDNLTPFINKFSDDSATSSGGFLNT